VFYKVKKGGRNFQKNYQGRVKMEDTRTTQEALSVPVMLTIRETAERFGLSEHYVRNLAKRQPGQVRTVKAGVKTLVNANSLCAYLNGEDGKGEANTER
jgi:hypothetical protein